MAGERRIASLKVETAKQRIGALQNELERLGNKSYSSFGTVRLLEFIKASSDQLLILLTQEEELINADVLSPAELELRSHRVTQILPALNRTLRFVSGSETDTSPAQLVQPLRRYVRSILPGSDIIVSAKPELNYSIQEIAALLRDTFSDTVLENCCRALPEYLFAINIPSTEFQSVLIHAILSHEFGHGLFVRRQIADRILPHVTVREDLLQTALAATQQMMPDGVSLPELLVRQIATQEIAERINNWIEEIACDVIGLLLFGPAFYFAYTNFLLSFSRLDNASKTHPPIRLRLKLMTEMLCKRYPLETLRPKISTMVSEWKDICSVPISHRTSYDEVAVKTLGDTDLSIIFFEQTESSLEGIGLYTKEKLKADLDILEPAFLTLIPIGESNVFPSNIATDIPSILNVAWMVYLSRIEDFRKKLPQGNGMSEMELIGRLQQLVLKSLEIAEIRSTHSEIA